MIVDIIGVPKPLESDFVPQNEEDHGREVERRRAAGREHPVVVRVVVGEFLAAGYMRDGLLVHLKLC